jgi:hypothetical protein
MIFKASGGSMIATSSVLFASFAIFAGLKSGSTKVRGMLMPVSLLITLFIGHCLSTRLHHISSCLRAKTLNFTGRL